MRSSLTAPGRPTASTPMAGKLARTPSGTAVLPERADELLDAAVEASTPSVAAAPAVPPSRARAAVARAVATLPSLDVVRAPAQMFVALLATSVLACSQRSAHAFRHHGTWAVITVTSTSARARARAWYVRACAGRVRAVRGHR